MSDTEVKTTSDSFSRPANTTAYASGDLVANSETAGSVTPLDLKFGSPGGTRSHAISRVKLSKSGTSITNASFRVHLYSASPTPANGDNGAFSTDEAATYVGSFDVTIDQAFTDGSVGFGVPRSTASEIPARLGGGQLYALIEARGAYTPASGETFTLTIGGYES